MVAGAIADRSDRKRMMFLADLVRAGLTAMIPLSVALGGPTMVVIVVVAAPMAVCRSFFLAGYTASVPQLVGRSQIGRANSYFEVDLLDGLHHRAGHRRPAGRVDRPGPDARHRRGLVRPVGVRHRRSSGATCAHPIDRPPATLVTDIREGIEYIVASPVLRTRDPLLGRDADPPGAARDRAHGRHHRDLGLEPWILGLVLAAYGVGTVVGSLVSARRIGRGRVRRGAHRRQPDDGLSR